MKKRETDRFLKKCERVGWIERSGEQKDNDEGCRRKIICLSLIITIIYFGCLLINPKLIGIFSQTKQNFSYATQVVHKRGQHEYVYIYTHTGTWLTRFNL